MKKITVSLILFILFFTTNSFSNQDIVYLDLDRVLSQSNAGKKFIEDFEKFKQKIIKDINKEEINLKKNESNIRLKKNILEASQYNKLVNDFKVKVNEFKIQKSKKIKNIENTRQNGTNNFLNKIVPILEKYSIDNSISLIIQKKNILIGKKELDITNLILKKVNQSIKTIEIK